MALEPAPAWASFFSPAEWRRFVAAVASELTRRGLRFRIDGGYVWAPWGSGPDEALSLLTVAQPCRRAGVERWDEIIGRYIDAFIAGSGDRALADALADDLARARPLLRPRLYPADTFAGQHADYVVRPVAEQLVAVLCFDLPANVVTVSAATAARWGVPVDDLWAHALANLRQHDHVALEQVTVAGVALRTMVADSFFVASNLLRLGDYLPSPPPLGALVVVPNRHTLVLHPIEDEAALRAINPLVVMACDMFAAGPGSVSPHLFWWRPDADLLTLPTHATAAAYEFRPPAVFVTEVMDRLAARAHMN